VGSVTRSRFLAKKRVLTPNAHRTQLAWALHPGLELGLRATRPPLDAHVPVHREHVPSPSGDSPSRSPTAKDRNPRPTTNLATIRHLRQRDGSRRTRVIGSHDSSASRRSPSAHPTTLRENRSVMATKKRNPARTAPWEPWGHKPLGLPEYTFVRKVCAHSMAERIRGDEKLKRERKHWSPRWPFMHPDSSCESPRICGRISAMAFWTAGVSRIPRNTKFRRS